MLDDVDAVFANLDTDGDGSISLDEFLEWCVSESLANKEDRILQAFHKMDLDGDGRLTVEELITGFDPNLVSFTFFLFSLISCVDYSISWFFFLLHGTIAAMHVSDETEIDRLLQEVDADHDGSLFIYLFIYLFIFYLFIDLFIDIFMGY
jgi:Ca2+-binding EF-hand superfamily protein